MKIKAIIDKILILFFLIAGTARTEGQIRLALYGGVHSANVIEKNSLPGWDTATGKFYAAKTGIQLGFLAEIPIDNKALYFQPGFVYISKGRKYSKYNDSNTAVLTDTLFAQSTLNLSYIEVPLYMTYKIPLTANHKSSFFVSAGPYFSFFFNGKMNLQNRMLSSNKFSNDNVDLNVGKAADKYNTFDMGLSAKAGFEFGNVMISAYVSQGLTNLYTASYSGSFHHRLLGATLGIWLTKATAPTPKPPKDTDLDGVNDTEDACPLQAGPVRWKGCPVPDSDHDGIDDENDSCKSVSGIAKYHGCPIPDTDGDGINDELDSCKTIAGTIKYHGCPIPDRDGDGLNDEEDRCPDQAGTKENGGCPIVKEIIQEKIRYQGKNVEFKSSSRHLTRNSYAALNAMAALLASHPELHLIIAGYTDTTGGPKYNLSLSQQRANAVKLYLVKKGVAETRITAVGYGSQHPVATNKTNKGKSMNRRVEFTLE
jgi:OOP family OmpA-OmpF porin